MKNLFKAVVILAVLCYAVGAFVNVSFNIASWSESSRINIAAIFATILCIAGPFVIIEDDLDGKSKYLKEVDKRIEELKKINSDGAK